MIITDINFLETVSETSIQGGKKRSFQSNYSSISQTATATAFGGTAIAFNIAIVNQANVIA